MKFQKLDKRLLKKKIQEIIDDNDNYIHSYTGTPMFMADKAIPKIMKLCDAYKEGKMIRIK